MSQDSPKVIQVALVDDHVMVRQALANVLSDSDRVEVVAEGGDRDEALEILEKIKPEVLVLDYSIPGGALAVIEQVILRKYTTRVLILTVHESVHYAVRVLEAGAHGFMVKSSAVQDLVDAIEVVRDGKIFIAEPYAQSILQRMRAPKKQRVGPDALSEREFELLRLLGQGVGLKEAAAQMHVSVSTASTYRTRIMEKLELSTTAEMIRFALQNDIVT